MENFSVAALFHQNPSIVLSIANYGKSELSIYFTHDSLSIPSNLVYAISYPARNLCYIYIRAKIKSYHAIFHGSTAVYYDQVPTLAYVARYT